MENLQFHTAFKLQGKSFRSKEELMIYSKEISSEVNLFLEGWFNDNIYVDVKTSGSTGKPKQFQLQKKHMINSAIATGEYFNLPEATTALLCISPNYIAGKMMLVRALTLGWHIDIVEATSNPLENTSKQYDFSAMVPLQLNNSLTYLYKVKKLIVGGGIVSKEITNKIQNVDTEIFATYGMTETITHIAVKKLNQFNTVIASETKQSHYKTFSNITISIDNRGCLVIKAPKISEEEVITNDLVELISDTSFKWLGRFDTIINSGGIKLIPELIEDKLSNIIFQRFFVAGIPDAILGEKLILVIENEAKNFSKKEVLMTIKNIKSLSRFEIPKGIYFVKRFIETPTRKVNRQETLNLINNIYRKF